MMRSITPSRRIATTSAAWCLLSALWVCGSVRSNAQSALTYADVKAAIAYGFAHADQEQGLILRDTAAQVAAGFGPAASGYTVSVYSPRAWVQLAAATAKRQYKPFTLTDASVYMRDPVVRIFVAPSVPVHTTKEILGVTSVHHVVLRDLSRTIVVQPRAIKTDAYGQGDGPDLRYVGSAVIFSLDDVRKVRGPHGNAEFFITVIGDRPGFDKDFQVKSKHFDRFK